MSPDFLGDFGLPCLTLQLMTRRTPFGCGHELEYGLKIVERRSDGNEVIAVQCQFCVFIGRETCEGSGV
jgi:hypothetical protein